MIKWPFKVSRNTKDYASEAEAHAVRTTACQYALDAMSQSIADGEHDFKRLCDYAVFFETFIAHGSCGAQASMRAYDEPEGPAKGTQAATVLKIIKDTPA